MSVTSNNAWKRSGPEYEAGCRVAPDELRRSLLRIATLTGADLVLLLRRRGDGSRFIRMAGVVNGGGNADDLAAAATRFPATVTTGTDSLSPDARMIVHWLPQPGDGGFALVLAVCADRPPFDADALRSVATACDWVDDVVELWWTNQRSEARAAALRAALANGGTHVILIDSHGMIVEANAGAARLLRQGCGLARRGEQLRAEHPDDDARLRKAILEITAAAASGRMLPPVQFAIRRGAGHHPLAVAVMHPYRLPAVHADEADPVVLVQIVDPDADEAPTAASCALYKLTPQETRLTEHLVAGQTIGEAAEQLKLSIDTARTYLKRIFAKTGVNRQASLVRLVLNSRMPLHRPPRDVPLRQQSTYARPRMPNAAESTRLLKMPMPKPLDRAAPPHQPGLAGALADDDLQLEMRLVAPAKIRHPGTVLH